MIPQPQDEFIEVRATDGGFVAEVVFHSQTVFATDPSTTAEAALSAARDYVDWALALPKAETVYYILAIPETWRGPKGPFKWSGLRVKIGRSRNVLRRLQNLQTGTSAQLIMAAIEPGGLDRERELHAMFSADRRNGEWFACSPRLQDHVLDTWARYNMLPPSQQSEMVRLVERCRSLERVRAYFGERDFTVNPSLHEDWEGPVFVDLVHALRLPPS